MTEHFSTIYKYSDFCSQNQIFKRLLQLSRLHVKMVKARKIIFDKVFDGLPKTTDFKIVEEELPPLKDGEFLAEAQYISVDPYIRAISAGNVPGNTVFGDQVAKVVESKHKDFPVGSYIVGGFGWRTHTIADGNDKKAAFGSFLPTYVIPDFGGLPNSLALGILGMPGNSGYLPLLDIINPQPGETIVVSGAAGAVGSLVGQIAKLKGSRVVGITGSDEKAKWLTTELGFDAAVNYKAADWEKDLAKATPNGIDGYFDNVGGDISNTVLFQMNPDGRVAIIGAVSSYNDKPGTPTKATLSQRAILFKQLTVRGFGITRNLHRWSEGVNQLKQWIVDGKIKYQETITQGFENTPKAFIGMLKGENKGKAIVKV